MTTRKNLQRRNHFVPQSYLRRFSIDGKKVARYELLASAVQVPLWRPVSIVSTAVTEGLYLSKKGGMVTDVLEREYAADVEAPSKRAIDKAVADERMTPADWSVLTRFFLAQLVRTPKFMGECIHLVDGWVGPALESVASEGPSHVMPEGEAPSSAQAKPIDRFVEDFPLRVKIRPAASTSRYSVRAETFLGRPAWHAIAKYIREQHLRLLLKERWTVIVAPDGIRWLTSDNPAMRLGYYSPRDFTFEAGLAASGTELVLPLSPTHMMYCRVGHKPPQRGAVFRHRHAIELNRMMCLNADRAVFARTPDSRVEQWRPRVVDAEGYRQAEETLVDAFRRADDWESSSPESAL